MRQLTREDWMKILLVAVIAILVISYFWESIIRLIFPEEKFVVVPVFFVKDADGNILFKADMGHMSGLTTTPLLTLVVNDYKIQNRDHTVGGAVKVIVKYTTEELKSTKLVIKVRKHRIEIYGKEIQRDETIPFSYESHTKGDGYYIRSGEYASVAWQAGYLEDIIPDGEKCAITIRWTVTVELYVRGRLVDSMMKSAELTLNVKDELPSGDIISVDVSTTKY